MADQKEYIGLPISGGQSCGSEYEVSYDVDNSIILDDYLDVLLNRDNEKSMNESWQGLTKNQKYYHLRYGKEFDTTAATVPSDCLYKNGCVYTGGLVRPRKKVTRGSGNVVIIGEPGVGKSTLAFQIAHSIISEKNKGIAVYYSLGVPRSTLMKNMLSDDIPEEKRKAIKKFELIAEGDSINDDDDDLYKHFVNQLSKSDETDKVIPQIVLPMLSPRGVSGTEKDSVVIYRQRYKEIEYMLRAIRKYNNEETNVIKVKAVIIDSLNEFSNEPLKKHEITHLFELFEYYGMLGIFTAGENKNNSQEELINVEAIKYDADTVIQLRRTQYKNYAGHLFSIVKSRYIKAVLGEHPYKIKEGAAFSSRSHTPYEGLRKHIEVLPSLHNIISGCSRNQVAKTENKLNDANQTVKNLFGIDTLDCVLPDRFTIRHKDIPQIIAIKGPSGGFKSDIAVSALMNSVSNHNSGLIIRLNDMDSFDRCGVRLEDSLTKKGLSFTRVFPREIKEGEESRPAMYPNKKRDFYCWKPKNTAHGYLYEIVFNSGALLPEEFVEDIIFIIKAYDVKTVVFTDIKYIGVSYPFLIENQTSGDLFLSAFIHIMRNMGVNLIMTSSKTEFAASSNELQKISILSDAVLECRINENNTVEVWGEGSIVTRKKCRILPQYDETPKPGDYAVLFDDAFIDLCPFKIEATD